VTLEQTNKILRIFYFFILQRISDYLFYVKYYTNSIHM